MQTTHQILKQYWGFDAFRPLQEEIIQSVLQKHDTLALLPTGGGKSICFQVPALAMDGLCLVVSPLIALMKDQVQNLSKRNIKAAAIYTGMPYRQIDAILDNCIYSDYKFLYVSPERLATDDFQARMVQMKINLLAIDEAHCISQWGYDFRPPYLKVAEVRDKLKGVPVIALTATATPEVVTDIQQKLHFKQPNVFKQSFARKNLSYVVRQAPNKNQVLLDIISKVNGSAIVYVRNRKRTKEYSDYLNKNHVKADFYHAGLPPNERSQKQDNWINNKTRVICSTNAFGMGIDKSDVRLVVHMDLADSLEAYFQEAGRAGRDENKAYAVQLINNSDLEDLHKKQQESYPTLAFIKEVYESLCTYFRITYAGGANANYDFDLRDFSTRYELNALKVLDVLKIMEQQGLIYLTDSISNLSKVKAIADKDVMYRFQVEHKKYEPLIKFILRTSEGVFEDFIAIEEEAIATRLKISAAETVEQLKALDKFRIFIYQARSEKPQIIFLHDRVKKEDLRLDMGFIKKRKIAFDERLKAIQYYVTETNVCRTRLLVKYFGEQSDEDCGVCDVCLSKKKTDISTDEFSKIVRNVESELKQTALSIEQLKEKLQVSNSDLNKALEFLLDAGKVSKAKGAVLKWVE